MSERTFTCEKCRGEFISSWSDKEAMNEARALMPDDPLTDTGVLCDVCYASFVKWFRAKSRKDKPIGEPL